MAGHDNRPVTVEMVLDVICAASYIAFVRLERAVDRFRAEGGSVEVVFRPFQLAPDTEFGGKPLLEVLTGMFGDHVVAETEQAARDALNDGVTLDYHRAVAAGTFEAHRLVATAARQGLAEPMVARLFAAHFSDGLDIADPGTLAALADEVGVRPSEEGAAELRAELDRVRNLGVRSVPQVHISGISLPGTQLEVTYSQALAKAAGKQAVRQGHRTVLD
ncbi:DsbA family protein [Streptomyces sp. 549]|uniref:DsbA family oxidoreductase n=1 Tax=Streptomyces sp. 549 TaxID=3049076 RepID=UPI0024C22D58|nr:DsbA family protein [Streptomyces sp. 549]MDK1474573.1 DsbA family protein [Streptomyces sp. 549]